MTSALSRLTSDYIAAYKANIASFRTTAQTNDLCAIGTRVIGICDMIDAGKMSSRDGATAIGGALLIGKQVAEKLVGDDRTWVGQQAVINQAKCQQQTAIQQKRDQSFLEQLAGIEQKLPGDEPQEDDPLIEGEKAVKAYDNLVPDFTTELEMDDQNF